MRSTARICCSATSSGVGPLAIEETAPPPPPPTELASPGLREGAKENCVVVNVDTDGEGGERVR